MPFPASDDSVSRLIRKLESRINELYQLIRGIRSERRPRVTHKRTRWKGVVTAAAGIAYGASGEVTIYLGGSASTWKQTCWNDWIDGGTLVNGMKVVVEFWPDENKFSVQDAGCA